MLFRSFAHISTNTAIPIYNITLCQSHHLWANLDLQHCHPIYKWIPVIGNEWQAVHNYDIFFVISTTLYELERCEGFGLFFRQIVHFQKVKLRFVFVHPLSGWCNLNSIFYKKAHCWTNKYFVHAIMIDELCDNIRGHPCLHPWARIGTFSHLFIEYFVRKLLVFVMHYLSLCCFIVGGFRRSRTAPPAWRLDH